MKHVEPPETLPVVPDDKQSRESLDQRPEPAKDVPFRDHEMDSIVRPAHPEEDETHLSEGPTTRSLQPIRVAMHHTETGPQETLHQLLDIPMVAEHLTISPSAVYRLVSNRRLPFYRLPAGIRFKVADIEAFLERGRVEPRPNRRYGGPQAQG